MATERNLDADDLAAALTAFAIGFTAVIMSPHCQTPNEVLEALANELSDFAHRMSETAAGTALTKTATMLMASEPKR